MPYIKIKKKIDKTSIALSVGAIAVFFIGWHLISVLGIVPRSLLASPVDVLRLFWIKWSDVNPDGALLGTHLWVSLVEALLGFFLSLVTGIPLGLAMGWFRVVEGLFRPFFEIIRPIPPLAWIPLTIFWFGIDLSGKVFIIWLAGVVPCVINSYYGVRMANPTFIQMSRVYGATSWQIFIKVCIPSALPLVFNAFQLALAACWTCLVAAELIAANQGLGYLITAGRLIGRPDVIMLGMLMVGLTGVMIGIIIYVFEGKLLKSLKR